MKQSKPNQRRIKFLDDQIQKWLLMALVGLELLLVLAAIWLLYGALNNIIEEQLYQIHFGEKVSIFQHLINEGARILGVFLLINLVILIVIDRVWAYRVNNVLRNLSNLMKAAVELDFTRKNHIHCTHPVLMHAVSWRHAEHDRIDSLRRTLQELPDNLSDTGTQQRAHAQLQRIQQLLPKN